MGNTFCKIEDSNKNKYILTDKNKQPLQCQSVLTSSNSEESEIGSCRIMNIKKILDDQTLINNENLKNPDFLNEDTKIPCKVIRDTREQNGWTFMAGKACEGTISGTLNNHPLSRLKKCSLPSGFRGTG